MLRWTKRNGNIIFLWGIEHTIEVPLRKFSFWHAYVVDWVPSQCCRQVIVENQIYSLLLSSRLSTLRITWHNTTTTVLSYTRRSKITTTIYHFCDASLSLPRFFRCFLLPWYPSGRPCGQARPPSSSSILRWHYLYVKNSIGVSHSSLSTCL